MADDKKKTITIKEFKMWLEGVEEMQDADWIPSASQWKRIREKLDSVAETSGPAPSFNAGTAPITYAGPSSIVAPAGTPPVTAPAYQPSNIMPPPPPSGLFANAEAAAIPVKTPSIDTSNGQYKSAFA
jgi:hypothetical protein